MQNQKNLLRNIFNTKYTTKKMLNIPFYSSFFLPRKYTRKSSDSCVTPFVDRARPGQK